MDQRFLDETVCRRPELFKAMVDFNRPHAVQGHENSLPSLGALGSLLLRDPVVRSTLGGAPARAKAEGWWDFSDETSRLLLMDDSSLKRAALSFSAAVYAEELAHAIDRKVVLELRRLLGEDIFTYALRRGRYQIGSLRGLLTSQTKAGTLAERIALLAASILLRLADGWPEKLRILWIGKLQACGLPASPMDGAETALPPLGRDQQRALWFTFKKLLLREAAPQWAPCFD